MSAGRSYEDKKPGQQLYGVIEFCTSPRALYAKIESGHYDWLGVRQDRQGRITYLLGRPRLSRVEAIGNGTAHHAETGQHRVEVRISHGLHPLPSESWWPTADEARAEFERLQGALTIGDGSALFRLRLIEDEQGIAEDFVVRPLPNVL